MLMHEIADIVRTVATGRRVPRLRMPDWGVRLYALFDSDVRGIINELGVLKRLDSSGAVALLGRPLLAADRAIADTTRTLIERGIA